MAVRKSQVKVMNVYTDKKEPLKGKNKIVALLLKRGVYDVEWGRFDFVRLQQTTWAWFDEWFASIFLSFGPQIRPKTHGGYGASATHQRDTKSVHLTFSHRHNSEERSLLKKRLLV